MEKIRVISYGSTIKFKMRNIAIKVNLFLFLLIFLSSCGFKPIYKLSENKININQYSIQLLNEDSVPREIKEEIKRSFLPSSNTKNNYIIEMSTLENLDPLITNTDGTVSKYRIEIVINYKVRDKSKNSYIIEDTVRGFAQYTVATSEIESDDKKKRMVRTATNGAIQMMISKIQSDTSITNDN